MSEAALAGGQSNFAASQMRAGNSSSSDIGNVANQLFDQYGVSTVQQAVNNAASDNLKSAMSDFISGLPMPQFMKDDAMGQINGVLGQFQSATPGDVSEGTAAVLGGTPDGAGGVNGVEGGGAGAGNDVVDGVMSSLKSSMQEETAEALKGSGEGAPAGNGNWLAILARSLGKTSGEHLQKMVELGEKMGGLDSTENPEEFAQIQSEFQAESQIFKMFQEAIGTMVKSIGEGMSTVARKQ